MRPFGTFRSTIDHRKTKFKIVSNQKPIHTAHRGWARLLLDRARDLIIHDPAHRGANGAAMPTDEDDQDGQGATPLPRRAQPLLLLLRSNPPNEGGQEIL